MGYEYLHCSNCVHKDKPKPNPCDSCEQPVPSNYTEEDDSEGSYPPEYANPDVEGEVKQ